MLEFELILPAYNEGPNLRSVISRAISAAKQNGFSPSNFQLIVVENGSTDDSNAILLEIKKTEWADWFRIVTVPVNQGYGHGILQGLKKTTAPVIAWSHADMQCDPHDAFRALALLKIQTNKKLLVRGLRSGRHWKDRLVTRVFQLFSYLILGMRISEINAQPKVFPRELLEKLKNPPPSLAFDLYVLFRASREGYQILSIPVLLPPRLHGVSKWASHFTSRYKTFLQFLRYMLELRHTEGRKI